MSAPLALTGAAQQIVRLTANGMTPRHPPLSAEIYERVGRNVLRAQALEHALKMLIPLVNLDGASHCLEQFGDRHAQFAMHTLGQLLGSFHESISTDDPGLKRIFDRILKDRNELVHHFHTALAPLLSTPEGCAEVNRKLDEQFETMKQLERMVNELLLGLLNALRDVTFRGTNEYDDFAVICEKFANALDSQDSENAVPARTQQN